MADVQIGSSQIATENLAPVERRALRYRQIQELKSDIGRKFGHLLVAPGIESQAILLTYIVSGLQFLLTEKEQEFLK